MRLFRTLPTRRLILLVAALLAAAVGATAIAMAASGSGGPTPPPEPLAQAIHDGLSAPKPDGLVGKVTFTNNLFPSGALLGNVGSALMSGASGRFWVTSDGRGRIELQSDAGDVQVVWSTTLLTVYDASSNTVYKLSLPQQTGTDASKSATPPGLAQIGDFLSKLGAYATISAAQPTNVGGQPAYSVSLSPKHDGGLLGSLELAWDAAHGVPLEAAIFAQGSSAPVLELKVSEISFAAPSASDVGISPPANAKVVDLGSIAAGTSKGEQPGSKQISGLAAVQAAAGFPVVAPDTLVGLPRQDVRLAQGAHAVIVLYGQGLGGIVVVEHQAAAGKDSQQTGILSNLPRVSLDGVGAHELSTQLGTVLEWQRGGIDYVLAGSLPTSAAETAARDLLK
ncbi:MAG: LolA family protein [Gaiellaceae bacterium]